MNSKFYLLKKRVNSNTHFNYLARMLGSGASSKEPYYLTSIPDFGVRCSTLFELFELIVELNKADTTYYKPENFLPVQYDMSTEQQSFSNPKHFSFENFISDKDAERVMKLDVTLLSESDKQKFIEKYGE